MIPFESVAVRVGQSYEEPNFCLVVKSRGELDDFLSEHRESYGLEAEMGGPSFAQTAAGYDEAFFAEHCLILVHLVNGSGSIQNEVRDVSLQDEQLLVKIESSMPGELGTTDMAAWFLLVAVPGEYGSYPANMQDTTV